MVFSHLKNPLDIFKKANFLLKRKGLFVFRTGNRSGLTERDLREGCWGHPQEHFSLLDNRSLKYLLHTTGFKVRKRINFGRGLLFISQPNDSEGFLSRAYSSLFYRTMGVVKLFIQHFNLGRTMIVIAEKV